MLLDPETWELVPGIGPMLATAATGAFGPLVKSELMQSVVEITTPICATAPEVGTQLRRLRSHVADAGEAGGFRVASAGTHPFSRFERQAITDDDRYRRMIDEFQLVGRQQLIFGLHVHVGVDDAEKAVRVVDGTAVHLAELLALSANSPFWRGRATGLCSYRQPVFATLPRTGIPPRFGDYRRYAEVVGRLERSGCISDYTLLWWDVRPHPRLGTVELRVCDAVTRVEDVVALAAYFQALVKMLCERVESGPCVESFDSTLTSENKWLAARYGLDASLIDLADGRSGRVTVRELVRQRIVELRPHARELGSERELESVLEILARGNGAEAQWRVWEETADPVEVTRRLAADSEVRAVELPDGADEPGRSAEGHS